MLVWKNIWVGYMSFGAMLVLLQMKFVAKKEEVKNVSVVSPLIRKNPLSWALNPDSYDHAH